MISWRPSGESWIHHWDIPLVKTVGTPAVLEKYGFGLKYKWLEYIKNHVRKMSWSNVHNILNRWEDGVGGSVILFQLTVSFIRTKF